MQNIKTNKKTLYRILAVAFWLLIWQILSMLINEEILLVSPFVVVKTLFSLSLESEFWISILLSTSKIVLGFLLALLVGALLAFLSYQKEIIKELISPLIKVIKATPVASFVILAIFWVEKEGLSTLICFLMVLPIVYTNLLQGIHNTDKRLLEMAQVFHIRPHKRIRYIYVPGIMPYFQAACNVGLGFCFKAGIAAEVIGLPNRSIGSALYDAKLYLATADLFAWTVVIILISVCLEKGIMWIIHLLNKGICG